MSRWRSRRRAGPGRAHLRSADLLYHFLVLLESREIGLADVCAVLEDRMGTSGLARRDGRPRTKGPAD
ncbi:phosphoribosyl-ATP pyrophosphatase [Methyloceanibacter methanicus]|uniref:phosphoribosyl-ATP pyrophosphatase n=1 Tax=Methyloceanibacter methanicus TaxID=1774968 RepID=UPI001FCE1091|nr:hypothetical protein [Methyloceanibacter methanicus]